LRNADLLIPIKVSWTALHTSIVDILSKVAFIAPRRAIPRNIIRIGPIGTAIDASCSIVVFVLVAGTHTRTSKVNLIPIGKLIEQRAIGDTLPFGILGVVIDTADHLTISNADSDGGVIGMSEGVVSIGTDNHALPCCIISKEVNFE
jgi:hypothetical protein